MTKIPRSSFLAHVGSESWTLVEETLRAIRRTHPSWKLGATAWVPRQLPSTTQMMVREFSKSTDFVIADPEYQRMEQDFSHRGVARREFSYLQESSPAANRPRFVTQALTAQVECGATVVVTPCLTHGVTGNRDALDATMDFARRSFGESVAKGRLVIIGLTATEAVFRDDKERNNLLDELVEIPKAPVYLRMRLSSAPPGRRPVHRPESLRGLRRAVESLAANGRQVLLPQCGLAGWLMIPFGATAFGAGTAASTQRSMPPSTGGGGQPPLDWYFFPQLLTFPPCQHA